MRSVPLEVAVAAPPLVLAIALVASLAMVPFERQPGNNVSEAAALHDAATVVQLLSHGADPGRRYPVRAGILDGDTHELTPLESAIEARRPEVVDVILWTSAIDREAWTRLRCSAGASQDAVIARVLDSYRHADWTASCEGTQP